MKADWRFNYPTLLTRIRQGSLSLILLCLLCSVILYICRGEILYRRGHLMVHISVDFELHISVDLLCGTTATELQSSVDLLCGTMVADLNNPV